MSNFNVYRCIDPLKTKTDQPWYRIKDLCPCDPQHSNVTGRGFTQCPFGLQFESPANTVYTGSPVRPENNLVGALFQDNQYVPPQLQPRPITRIGTDWRSSN